MREAPGADMGAPVPAPSYAALQPGPELPRHREERLPAAVPEPAREPADTAYIEVFKDRLRREGLK